MLPLTIKFLASLVILLFSTSRFVSLTVKLSKLVKISPLIIGLTVVAIGTSLPELAVSTTATLQGDTGLALGNIIGSNITNILLIFSLAILLGNLRIGTTKTQKNTLFLSLTTIIFILTQVIPSLKTVAGPILLITMIILSIIEYYLGVEGRLHEDAKLFKKNQNKESSFSIAFFFIFYLLAIIISSYYLVESVEAISLLTKINTTILGLTLTSITTSLPELLTTIISLKNNQEKLTLGNIIGSNIYNLLLVGSIITSIKQHPSAISNLTWFWLIFSTALFVLTIKLYRNQKPPRYIGLIGLAFFFIYLSTQS